MSLFLWRIYSDSGYLLDISDPTTYGTIPDSGGLGMPQANPLFANVWGGFQDPIVGVDYGNREAEFGIYIRSTSLDGWVTNDQQLKRVLYDSQRWHASAGEQGAAAYISVQMNGMTYPIEWDILRGDVDNGSGLLFTPMKNTASPLSAAVLHLTLRPWSRPQAFSSAASGTLNNGGGVGATSESYTVSAPAGDVPYPIALVFLTPAGDDFRKVTIWKRSRGNAANFIPQMHCEAGTYTGYTVTHTPTGSTIAVANTVVATAHGGNTARITSDGTGTRTGTVRIRYSITKNLRDFYGRFRVRYRHDSTGANFSSGSAQLRYGGDNGIDIANDVVTISAGATDILADLGLMDIPHRALANQALLSAYNFEVLLTVAISDNGGATATWGDADCIDLVPVDTENGDEYAEILLSAVAPAQDQLIIDGRLPLARTYLQDSSGNVQPENVQERPNTYFTLVPGADARFGAVYTDDDDWTDSGAHDLTDQYLLLFLYHIHYFLGRTS